MKDEVRRIMKLVEEGKLSAADAMDLIDAFEGTDEPVEAHHEEAVGAHAGGGTPPPPPPPPPAGVKGDLHGIIDQIEKAGKDFLNSVNWKDLGQQVQDNAKRGVDALKKALEDGGVKINFFGHSENKVVDLPLVVEEGKTLRVENVAGDVVIRGKQPLGNVRSDATIRGATEEDVRERADRYNLVIEESDHFVDIKQPDINGVSADLQINLSNPAPVEIKTRAGDIKVEHTGAAVRVLGTNGDVTVIGADGVIEISTTSGDIKVHESTTTSLTADNKSGDIRIDTVTGTMNLRSASGDVTVDNSSGRTVAVEAISGDVRIDLNKPVEGSLNVRSVSGDTRVAIPDGSSARVTLATLSGAVSCGLELTERSDRDQRITGRLGDGAGTIDISAVSGDVELSHRAAEIA